MTDPDVIAVIAEQHEGTKQALRGLLRHRGAERADLFRKVRVTMALHETAELLTVHPEAVRQLGGNDRSILDRVAEESEAGQLIGRLELLDIDSDAFVDGFEELATSVIRHAQSEETDEWPVLREITDMAANERMVAVMSAVPGFRRGSSRPRPGCEFLPDARVGRRKARPRGEAWQHGKRPHVLRLAGSVHYRARRCSGRDQ